MVTRHPNSINAEEDPELKERLFNMPIRERLTEIRRLRARNEERDREIKTAERTMYMAMGYIYLTREPTDRKISQGALVEKFPGALKLTWDRWMRSVPEGQLPTEQFASEDEAWEKGLAAAKERQRLRNEHYTATQVMRQTVWLARRTHKQDKADPDGLPNKEMAELLGFPNPSTVSQKAQEWENQLAGLPPRGNVVDLKGRRQSGDADDDDAEDVPESHSA